MNAQALAERPVELLRNMTPFDEVTEEILSLYEEAKNWADGEPITTQKQCDALDVIDKALLDAGKRLDALRVEEKRPLDEQVQAIQDRYNPFIQPKKGKVDLARSTLNPLRSAWKEAERQRKEAIAAEARREAEEAQRKAQEAIRASAGNLEAREQAEAMLTDAEIAQRDAKRTHKQATQGLGLRTSYSASLTDLNAAIRHYWATRQTDFSALVQSLADDDVRRGIRTIPGFTITEERKAL